MPRRFLALCAFVALAGCLTTHPVPTPQEPSDKVRLFGMEILADEGAVREAILRVVPPGTPMEQAQAALADQFPSHADVPVPGRGDSPADFGRRHPHWRYGARCRTTAAGVLGEWGKRAYTIWVLLLPDAARAVKDVDVYLQEFNHLPHLMFFEARPQLQEPVGLQLDAAVARMQTAGFECHHAAAWPGEPGGKAHVLCVAPPDATSHGLIGVRLFADPAGVVRDTEICSQYLKRIRVCGNTVLSEPWAVREQLLRVVPPGMPMDQALTALKEQGFAPQSSPEGGPVSFKAQMALRNAVAQRGEVYCYARAAVPGEWGLSSGHVLLIVAPDAAKAVQNVDVLIALSRSTAYADFFKAHPELEEPVGLPVAEARARLQAAGFKCKVVSAADSARGKEYLHCEYKDDRLLDGRVIRILLFYDENGVVRDTAVPQGGHWYDAERAMLPDADDPLGRFAWRAALFPAHAVSRYAFFTAVCVAGVTLWCLAHSR